MNIEVDLNSKKKHLMDGNFIRHEVKNFMCWDIDNKFDFKIAECLAKSEKLCIV